MDTADFVSPWLFVTLHFLTFSVTLVPLQRRNGSFFIWGKLRGGSGPFVFYPDILLWGGTFLGSVGFAHCIHLVKQPRGNIWKAMVPLKTWTNLFYFPTSCWCKILNFSQAVAKVPPSATFFLPANAKMLRYNCLRRSMDANPLSSSIFKGHCNYFSSCASEQHLAVAASCSGYKWGNNDGLVKKEISPENRFMRELVKKVQNSTARRGHRWSRWSERNMNRNVWT